LLLDLAVGIDDKMDPKSSPTHTPPKADTISIASALSSIPAGQLDAPMPASRPAEECISNLSDYTGALNHFAVDPLADPTEPPASFSIASPARAVSPGAFDRMFTCMENGFSAQRVASVQIDGKNGISNSLTTFQTQVNHKFVDIDAKFAEVEKSLQNLQKGRIR